MRWVMEEAEFRKIFLEARTCVYIDSGRESSRLQRLIFDDAMTCTFAFAELLQNLMEWSGIETCNYVVLDPDPVHYFYRLFKKYPAFEVALGDSPQSYIQFLNQDPGGSPADAVGTNCWAWVVAPPAIGWFVHALRSDMDNGGHLWIPNDWRAKILGLYPSLRGPQ
jgi:hypothetical protein